MREKSFLGLSAAGFHTVAYTEWGAPDATRPVVCVHGLTRNGRDFDPLAASLAGTGRRVACPDVVGRGRSGWLADPMLYGFPQYMADMAALLARLDAAEVDWVGTSMGGLIGMFLAARPGSPIRRLVLNDVGPFVPKAALDVIAAYVGQAPAFPDLEAAEGYLRTIHAAPLRMRSGGTWPSTAPSARPMVSIGWPMIRPLRNRCARSRCPTWTCGLFGT